jgi:hypothetical protein
VSRRGPPYYFGVYVRAMLPRAPLVSARAWPRRALLATLSPPVSRVRSTTSLSSLDGVSKLVILDLYGPFWYRPTPCPAPPRARLLAPGDRRLHIVIFRGFSFQGETSRYPAGTVWGSVPPHFVASMIDAWSDGEEGRLVAVRSTTRSGWATRNIVRALFLFFLTLTFRQTRSPSPQDLSQI